MRIFVLANPRLLKNKKFLRLLCILGIEVDAYSSDITPDKLERVKQVTLVTNQPLNFNFMRLSRKWRKLLKNA